MKTIERIAVFTLFLCMVAGIVSPAFAGRGNNMPSGPHYELGLIGRPNEYTGSGTNNSNRHNIFIPLDTSGYVDGKIKLRMTQGDGFLVIDGDATSDGLAKLQINRGYYAVFARALGKPGGNLDFTAWFTYWIDDQQADLSDAIWLGNVDLTRNRKKPQTVEISKLFYYSGYLLYDPDGVPDSGDEYMELFTNDWVFDILGFNEYWWDIDNNGLKRLEIRFYPVPAGYVPPPLP
jgi:hypothetical protein